MISLLLCKHIKNDTHTIIITKSSMHIMQVLKLYLNKINLEYFLKSSKDIQSKVLLP
jgi:hypothetical protein